MPSSSLLFNPNNPNNPINPAKPHFHKSSSSPSIVRVIVVPSPVVFATTGVVKKEVQLIDSTPKSL